MSNPQTDDTNQYLTFSLDKEIFALDITQVREVLEVASVTRIPRTPEFMRGVINLRGHAVPVVDMRSKFGMPSVEDTVDTCIVITEVDLENESAILGALVDSVREVFEMPPEDIEPAPRMGTSIRTDFIRGMGKQDDNFVIILDINRIFSSEELAVLATAEGSTNTAEETAEAV